MLRVTAGVNVCLYRSDQFGDKAAIGLARLEKVCDPTSGEAAADCDAEAMDSSDNEVDCLTI